MMNETGVSLEKPPARLLYHTDLKWWLLDWIGKAHASSVERMMLLVYNLWLARNEARDSDRIADPADIVWKTLAGLEEWLLANNMAPKELSKKVEHWLPSEPNWFKVNVDGAFRSAENKGGAAQSFVIVMVTSFQEQAIFSPIGVQTGVSN
jgi:hypothetical protein